ncbi:MAG: hypothetical protein ACLGXA_08010 [Acidobacteriota bacterium]
MNSPTSYTPAEIPVTDGAEVLIYAATVCGAVYLCENPGTTGWPRAWLFRGNTPGSQQQQQGVGATMRVPGPFSPGDLVGSVELVSAGGASSEFYVQELPQ